MKTILAFFIAVFVACWSRAQTFPPANEVDGTFNSSSYDTSPYFLWGDYFATYFYDMYPQFTNHIYNWSRSGSSWNLDYTDQEEKWCLPLWASFPVPGNDWILANDNGSYDSTATTEWGTNIFAAPGTFWNGTGVTNEGVTTKSITHYALGRIPSDSSDGNSGNAISGNSGATNLDGLYGTPIVDMWHLLWTNGLSTDVVGSRLFGFYAGGHPFPAGHLCMALRALVALGAETNVGSFTLNWAGGAIGSTNHCVVSGSSLSGSSLSFTVHFDRMPPAWDVPDGTLTNDARNAFVLMPDLGNLFQWTLQVTNLPAGFYNLAIDGSNVVTMSSTQLAAGWNMFTNYAGPLWAQRIAVLNAKRDQEGADHVTLLTHSAGNLGVLGSGDNVNYQSNAAQQYDTNGKRGTTYVSSMSTWVSQLQQYDLAIWQAAQQTNHTFSITLVQPRFAPFHR